MDRSKNTVTFQECSERKKGQSPFAGTARRVLRTKGDCPIFLSVCCFDSVTVFLERAIRWARVPCPTFGRRGGGSCTNTTSGAGPCPVSLGSRDSDRRQNVPLRQAGFPATTRGRAGRNRGPDGRPSAMNRSGTMRSAILSLACLFAIVVGALLLSSRSPKSACLRTGSRCGYGAGRPVVASTRRSDRGPPGTDRECQRVANRTIVLHVPRAPYSGPGAKMDVAEEAHADVRIHREYARGSRKARTAHGQRARVLGIPRTRLPDPSPRCVGIAPVASGVSAPRHQAGCDPQSVLDFVRAIREVKRRRPNPTADFRYAPGRGCALETDMRGWRRHCPSYRTGGPPSRALK